MGLVVVEATAVRADGKIGPLSVGLWNERHVAGMARLVDAVKSEGAAVMVQLNHAGARSVPIDGGVRGASPSGVAFRADVRPTVLTESEIAEFVGDFVSAAVRAREAGFDGVEIHGAHLYLISQFLSPVTNLRTDRYGGDAAGRATFALEVLRGVRAAAPGLPASFRLNTVELVEGGLSTADALVVARLLQEAGACAIHASLVASGGFAEADGARFMVARSALSKEQPVAGALPYAAELKKGLRVPVIGVGKIGAAEAEQAVRSGAVDLVALGRQMIADPDAAGKILDGRAEDIVPCRECWGCFECTAKGKPVVCTVNRNVTGEPVYL